MKMHNLPYLVVCDSEGNIFEIPEYHMVGASAATFCLPLQQDLIPLPLGSDLFILPGRIAVGYDPVSRSFVPVKEYNGTQVFAVAAFMAPAYVQIYASAYISQKKAPRLPLYSYTAVGWHKGKFYVAGARIDADRRQDLKNFNLNEIRSKAVQKRKAYPTNRLLKHLVENCVLRYGCPAARNFAMGRWECPLPTAPTCNAACLGCLSLQPASSKVNASHERLRFIPTPQEIADIAVPHLQKASRPVVSFGQGCEGEPLLVAEVVEQAIRLIRTRTERGIINMNTNGSNPDQVERLCKAGLDSIRVSMNSAMPQHYESYYRPKNYGFSDVVASLDIMRKYNRWSSINYFIFPGLSDHPQEIAALDVLIRRTCINMIQTRNLNIDPQWYMQSLNLDCLKGKPIGIGAWIDHIRKRFPWIKLGYFNPPREEMMQEHFAF